LLEQLDILGRDWAQGGPRPTLGRRALLDVPDAGNPLPAFELARECDGGQERGGRWDGAVYRLAQAPERLLDRPAEPFSRQRGEFFAQPEVIDVAVEDRDEGANHEEAFMRGPSVRAPSEDGFRALSTLEPRGGGALQ
jgi:hypothetical protein